MIIMSKCRNYIATNFFSTTTITTFYGGTSICGTGCTYTFSNNTSMMDFIYLVFSFTKTISTIITGLTMAEYFRDVKKQDVLLFIDNIFRFVQAGSEVSALLGDVCLLPLDTSQLWQMIWVNLQERIASTKDGSVTSVQAVYVPADDLTDPAPATTFSHLDATTVLSRKIVEQGIYPAVDPLESTSRILEADVVGEEHYRVAREVQETLQKYKATCRISSQFLVWRSFPTRISRRFTVRERYSVSCHSHSMWLRILRTSKVYLYRSRRQSVDSRQS